MKWVTRERPKIDRIACPWLIARFIDEGPEFIFVPSEQVLKVANETGAIPYDVPDVELSHVGELCSFDAFLRKYELDEPELQELALIVRGADTGRLDLRRRRPACWRCRSVCPRCSRTTTRCCATAWWCMTRSMPGSRRRAMRPTAGHPNPRPLPTRMRR